jgi:CRP-like cAMP-binding protein
LTSLEATTPRSRATSRKFARGGTIFREHGTPDRVYVALTGFVKLSRLSEEGREVILAIRGPAISSASNRAIDGSPRSATAVALDPVTALVMSAGDFLAFLEDETARGARRSETSILRDLRGRGNRRRGPVAALPSVLLVRGKRRLGGFSETASETRRQHQERARFHRRA